MNTQNLNYQGEDIPCSNPKLLIALLKRAATAAKANFRTTEGELMWMYQCVDLVGEMKDTVNQLNKELIELIEKKPKRSAKPTAGQKVVKAKAKRRKRRSDFGKKREGKALENIRKAQYQRKAQRRLQSRLQQEV